LFLNKALIGSTGWEKKAGLELSIPGLSRKPEDFKESTHMRKHFIWVLGLALAVGIAGVAFAGGGQEHTVKAKVLPAKQDKNRFGPASFNFTTASTCSGDNCRLNAANRVRVYIDDDIRLTTRGLPVCQPSRLADTTTAQARARCRSSQVGQGNTIAFIAGNPEAAVSGQNTVFNGPPRGGRPTLIVHNRIDAVGSTVVLIGVYKPGTGDFGNILDVNVPALPLGTALASFQTKVQRSYRFRGRTRHYVTARCHDNNRKWNFKGRDDYGGGQPPLTASVSQTCTVRR
jgi:hypothetical protein